MAQVEPLKGAQQMGYDKQQVAEKLNRWERFLESYRLPEWEELPKIDLYLDQVIALVNNYVGFFVYDPAEEKLLTPSMVNNYVKLRLIPAPVRKKYGRRHIALLLMLCTFKQSVSMAAMSAMLPPDDEEIIHQEYVRFTASYLRISRYVVQQAKASAEPIYDEHSSTGTEVSDLVVGSAIAASFARLLAGKLIALHEPEQPIPPVQPEE
jgi:preprotein translocase subunit Sss1